MSYDQSDRSKSDILIVDDTPANLQLLSKMLSEQGYRVRPVPNGSVALSVAQVEPPDLVLLDIRMPEMDGYAVCKHLKADPQTRDIPIIFISALDATQDKVTAFTAGGVDYVTKPFQNEEVLARVETHLALRNLQKQLQDANKRMEQELALAGEVQASFLPDNPPTLPGWQISATLKPAREASGDFYDFIPLPDSRWGIVVADVADKGAGAALYMALCCTLLRTYAADYPAHPELVFDTVNRRIIEDTNAEQFVTIFYGILDPATGSLVYCNAGHCPPFLIDPHNDDEYKQLIRTGVPLGIFKNRTWKRDEVKLEPGGVLVLYSDGITEAQNVEKRFFGEDGLRNALGGNHRRSAQDVQKAIMTNLNRYIGITPQSDDIVLAVLFRECIAEE